MRAESGQEYFNLHVRMRLHLLAGNPAACVRAFEEATAGDPVRARRFVDLDASGFYLPQLMRVTLGAAVHALGRHHDAIAAIRRAREPYSGGEAPRGIVPWLVHLGLATEIRSLLGTRARTEAVELSRLACSRMSTAGDMAVFAKASQYYTKEKNRPLPASEDPEHTAEALEAWHAMSWY